MSLSVTNATKADAATLAALRTSVAEHLTRTYGHGHWSAVVTERSIATAIKTSRVLAARDGPRIVGTLRLATKKPWAIDRAYFANVKRPLYLTDMAVEPARQRQGIGRFLMQAAEVVARSWPADSIRLDAYDDAAGAGLFYAKCGFRKVGRKSYRGVSLVYFELLLH